MTVTKTLTSYIITGYDSDDHPGGDTNLIQLSYADLDFTPSASDSYKSTSGDILKVYVDGVRIYRAHDETFASGSGFLEDGDNANGQTLNGKTLDKNGNSLSWSDTSDNVWTIDTSHKTVTINISNVHATNLYHNNALTTDDPAGSHNPAHGQQVKFTSGTSIIELRRAVQDLKTPAIDFSNASILTEQDLDNSAKNVFHISQQAVLSTEDAMLYDSGTGTYKATQPGTSNARRISSVDTPLNPNDAANKEYVDGSNSTQTVAAAVDAGHISAIAGEITPTNNISTVAGKVSDIEKVAHLEDGTTATSAVSKVASREAEIGRLGTTAYSDGANAYLAKLGVDSMSNATTGNIKKVADIDDKVVTVAGKDDEVGLLGVAGVIEDMGYLGTQANVTAMGHLGTQANVTNMSNLTATGVIDDLATLGSGKDGKSVGTSGYDTGTHTNISQINTVATNISSVSNFADTYHPSIDNDDSSRTSGTAAPGSAGTLSTLTEGDLWFDSVADTLKVYDGSSWGSASSSIATVASQNEFTASNGQGTDNKYFALVHDVGLELVFLNGVRLKRGSDYYCTNSNTSTTPIASGNAATFVRLETVPGSSDILSVMAFGQIANNLAVNTAGGTFTGGVTFEGQNTHNTGSNTFTMPTTRGSDNYVLTRDDSVGTGGTTWKESAVAPTIASIKYSNQTSGTFVENSGQTATDPAGGDLVQLTGTNFDSTLGGSANNIAISIDGTSATSISVNSAKTEVTFAAPAKSAGSYTLTATNGSGLNATTTISYDATPAWVTAAAPSSSLGNFVDGSITGTNGPQIIASESGSNLTTGYKRVTSNTDNTVITTAIAGLTLGNNGYLTGTLAGTNGATNTFYAVAHDNENQQSAIRQFHFISYDYAGSGGTETFYTDNSYRVHSFLQDQTASATTFTFTVYKTISADILIVAGGGGGAGYSGGGGGAGGVLQLTTQTLNAGNYTITVGAGGTGSTHNNTAQTATGGSNGGNSSVVQTSGTGSYSQTATGGGVGGSFVPSGNTGQAPGNGGSGGGGGPYWGSTGTVNGGTGNAGNHNPVEGYNGGSGQHTSGVSVAGGGGGGAGGAGGNASGTTGGQGGIGIYNYWRDGNTSGTTLGIHKFGGGGIGDDNGSPPSNLGWGGGSGGGGNGSAHTGGGGGGNTYVGNNTGGTGGSGIVVIRYAI